MDRECQLLHAQHKRACKGIQSADLVPRDNAVIRSMNLNNIMIYYHQSTPLPLAPAGLGSKRVPQLAARQPEIEKLQSRSSGDSEKGARTGQTHFLRRPAGCSQPWLYESDGLAFRPWFAGPARGPCGPQRNRSTRPEFMNLFNLQSRVPTWQASLLKGFK